MLKAKNTWFKSGGKYKSMMMIPATPGSELKLMIEQRIESVNNRVKVRIVEKPGKKLIHHMKQVANKVKKQPCDKFQDCMMCKTEKGGHCQKNEIVYQMSCTACDNVYIGESHRNGFTRGSEHLKDAKAKSDDGKEKSVITRHNNEKHDGADNEFKMKILHSFHHSRSLKYLC